MRGYENVREDWEEENSRAEEWSKEIEIEDSEGRNELRQECKMKR